MPSLMELTRLMGEAPQDPSNPFLRQAMKGAQQEFIQPPPIDPTAQTSPITLSSGQSVSPFDAKLGPSEEDGPEPGVMNTGQSGYQNRHVLDSPEGESRPGFFHSDEFKNIANMGMGMLGGAAGGALAGDWRAGMAGGGAVQLRDFQNKQKDMLDRQHKAWESAYNDAISMPADIHTTPGMEEVAKAQQAILRDLQDGKVDNKQTLTNWLTVKAMYGGDIEKMQMDSKLADQKRMEDEKYTNDMARKEQEAGKWYALANDPTVPPNDQGKLQAQAKLAEYEQVMRQQQHQAEQDHIANRRADTAEAAQASRDRNQHGYQTAMISGQQSRERIANSQIASREKINQQAQFGNKLKALVAQASKNNPEVPEKVHLTEAVKSLGGVVLTSPGNAMIMGEPIRLQEIFGDRPELWGNDPPGTPSPKGWDVLISLVGNQVELAETQARQSQPMGLSNYPPQAFQQQ